MLVEGLEGGFAVRWELGRRVRRERGFGAEIGAAVRFRWMGCEASGDPTGRPHPSIRRRKEFRRRALAQVSYEGEEIGPEAAAKARIDFQQKRPTLRDFVIHAAKPFEVDCSQDSREEIQIGATVDDL